MITVVSAAIIQNGRMFLSQRSGDTSCPWAWCTPGGKAEGREFPRDVIQRELSEEVGLSLAPDAPLSLLYQVLLDSGVTVVCYRVDGKHVIGQPKLGDKTIGFGWFDAKDITRLMLAPADDLKWDVLVRALTT